MQEKLKDKVVCLFVHFVDRLLISLVDDATLQLHRSGQLTSSKRHVLLEESPLTNLLSIGNSLLLVVSVNDTVNVLLPLRVIDDLLSGGSRTTKSLGLLEWNSTKFIRGLTLSIRLALQGNQAGQELSLITNDNDVGDGGTEFNDRVLNVDGRNVLTTSSDNEFLQSASDIIEAILIDLADITSVNPALGIKTTKSLFRGLQVTTE